MIKNLLFLCAVTVFLSACSSLPVISPQPETIPANTVAKPTPTFEDIYEVTAWVDNPYPKAGERINISGSLTKNGVYLGGMMMSAFWPDKDDDRLVDCTIQVIYQRGICIVYAEDFPVGEYTPVKVSFNYFGQTFSGETGFTRQE
jgi:hypothetical protein